MARPDDAEIEYVVSNISAAALERAAGDEASMRRFAHDWFPDLDVMEHRAIGRTLAKELMTMAARVHARRQRLERAGKARCPK